MKLRKLRVTSLLSRTLATAHSIIRKGYSALCYGETWY